MAIDSIGVANAGNPSGASVVAIGGRSSIVTVVTDANSATVASAAELLAPFSYATAGQSRWIRRGETATRAYFFARMAVAGTVTTDPIIRIYGAAPIYEATAAAEAPRPTVTSSIPNDGTWKAFRLDSSDFNLAGLTLDLVSAGATLNNDSTYAYSDETVAIDLQDCWYFTALVETRANVNSGTVPIYARLTA